MHTFALTEDTMQILNYQKIGKVKYPVTDPEDEMEDRGIALPFFTSVPRPGRFTPGKEPVPIVQEAGCAPGPVWMSVKNLSLTGNRSPDHPTRSQSPTELSRPHQKIGLHLTNIGRFSIHKRASSDNQLNDTKSIFPNIICDTI
jgi:hypothetical protein